MKIKLNHFEPPKAFRSQSHFENFADTQIEKYSALNQRNPTAYSQWGKQLQNHWVQAKGHASHLDADVAAFERAIRNHPCMRYGTAFTNLLEDFSSRGLNARIDGALRSLVASNDGQNISSFGLNLGASQAAAVLTIDQAARSTATKKRLDEIVGTFEESLDKLLEADGKLLEAKREKWEEITTENERKFTALRSRAAKAISEANANWLQAYDSYVEQLKTETAVKLWEQRAGEHQLLYKSFRKSSMIVAGLGGVIALIWIFAGFGLAKVIFPDDRAAQIASFSAGSIMLLTLLVWTLRVLVRSMMSENHLATDASARSAMAHTYLALIKEEAASQDDRSIILASLFAPVNDGIVKDDGLPILSPAALAASSITNAKP